MRLSVNGEMKHAPDGASLAEVVAGLLASLEIEGGKVAVELNLEIAPRSRWADIQLSDGDRLEIVHFVGGG